MQKACLILFIWCAGALAATAQTNQASFPHIEIFGGYSYLHDTNLGDPVTFNFNGWEASLNYNLNKWLGIKADFAGHYYHSDLYQILEHQHEYLLGPQVSWRAKKFTVFGHGLIGISHKHGETRYAPLPGVEKFGEESFTSVLGGGADWNLTKHISWRVAQIDYQRSRSLFEGLGVNELRAASGIVFRFGGK
jgi:hypothetical protein